MELKLRATVAGYYLGAQAADQQGDYREDAGFGEDGNANRQANRQQALLYSRLQPVIALEYLAGAVVGRPADPPEHTQQHGPHDQAGGRRSRHRPLPAGRVCRR